MQDYIVLYAPLACYCWLPWQPADSDQRATYYNDALRNPLFYNGTQDTSWLPAAVLHPHPHLPKRTLQ